MRMEAGAIPFYLQFKLSEHLKTNRAKEASHISGRIQAPYRRFHITSTARSNQHAMLVGLGAVQEHVYYVAPNFYQLAVLSEQWRSGYVADASVFVRPSDIGSILDDEKHAVCFSNRTLRDRQCYLFSDPKPLKPFGVEELKDLIATELDAPGPPLKELLPIWSQNLDKAALDGQRIHREQLAAIEAAREKRWLARHRQAADEVERRELRADFPRTSGLVEELLEEPISLSRTRVENPPRIQRPIDPAFQKLADLGRRASSEFYSQLFVLQRTINN